MALILAPSLFSQSDDTNEPPPLIVRNLIVNFTGLSNVNEEVARANMSLREGEPVDSVTIDRDIRSLYRSGLFEYVEVRLAPVDEDNVDVIFDIRPKFRISAVNFEGNDRVSDSRLLREIDVKTNQVLNEPTVKGATETLQEFYVKKGFSQARIEYNIDRSPSTGFATVTFVVTEGRKFKIGKVVFEGNEAFKDKKLRRQMETKKWNFLSVFTGGGKFDRDKFEDDLEKLKDYYRNDGYLDIEIDPADVTFSYPSQRRMRIEIAVEEGKQYRVGSIDFEGNETYIDPILQLLLSVRPGAIYEPEKIDEDVRRIEDFYGQFGYMKTRVRMERVPNVTTGNIDIVYHVRESELFRVESLQIEGNTKTRSVVVLRELALSPGSVFDSVRMEASRMRLENSRYFEDVNVSEQSTNIPGRQDLAITFSEGRTGNFTFGAGFNSIEKGQIFVELTQSNFDIMNWRGAFQGDGQKFRLRATLGGQSSNILLAFEEPWLFEKRLAFGFQIFNQTTDYDFQNYETESRGFEVYLRRRLIELIEGRLSYSFTDKDYSFAANIPERQRLLSSIGVTSQVGLTLLRDTRDRLLNTFRGARYELNLNYAGGPLGGDFDYIRIESDNAYYFPISQTLTQTVEFLVRVGVMDETNDDTAIPIDDRFYLGGPNTLRGFEYRDVSPRVDGYYAPHLGIVIPSFAPGGKTYGLFGAEYSLGITEDFRIAAFYDGGFVNKDAGDFSLDRQDVFDAETGSILLGYKTSGWHSDYGIGIRMKMAGTPMRIDYAIPLKSAGTNRSVGGNDEGAQFNFTFGGRF